MTCAHRFGDKLRRAASRYGEGPHDYDASARWLARTFDRLVVIAATRPDLLSRGVYDIAQAFRASDRGVWLYDGSQSFARVRDLVLCPDHDEKGVWKTAYAQAITSKAPRRRSAVRAREKLYGAENNS